MPHLHEVECNSQVYGIGMKERTIHSWDKGGLRERHSTIAGPDGWKFSRQEVDMGWLVNP